MRRPARIQKAPVQHVRKEQPWLRDRDHLSSMHHFICLKCGRCGCSIAAHIRLQTDGAAHRKPSDCFVVPLCGFPWIAHGCHEIQGGSNPGGYGEATFWAEFMAAGGSDPWGVAQALWRCSGDIEAGERIIFRARQMLKPAPEEVLFA